MVSSARLVHLVVIFVVLLQSSCAMKRQMDDPRKDVMAYGLGGESLLERIAPVFVIENPGETYNRIGTVVALTTDNTEVKAGISPEKATIYAEERRWQGKNGSYTNLVYRINFSESPFQLAPFNVSSGKNTGLFVIVTLNHEKKPVLYTTVHTCGCYLAFIPTEDLPRNYYPVLWPEKTQEVYGEYLPAFLPRIENDEKVYVTIRETTHRVTDIYRHSGKKLLTFPYEIGELLPLESLQKIAIEDGEVVSFFETEGSRKDYVVDSQKIWERILISWWALDLRVGEDKRLGRDTSDGIVFYTSLKPWAREDSDLRDFPRFLEYWGWRL